MDPEQDPNADWWCWTENEPSTFRCRERHHDVRPARPQLAPDQRTAIREAIARRAYVVCMTKCWPCQFDSHPGIAHTWMDADDIDHAGPTTAEAWIMLAVNHPCGCYCQQDSGGTVG